MKKAIIFLSLSLLSLLFVISACNKEDEDTVPPVITLIGNNPMQIDSITGYTEPGATAIDDVDEDISSELVITNNINTSVLGYYQVKYNVSDKAGNAAVEVVRTVQVITF